MNKLEFEQLIRVNARSELQKMIKYHKTNQIDVIS